MSVTRVTAMVAPDEDCYPPRLKYVRINYMSKLQQGFQILRLGDVFGVHG